MTRIVGAGEEGLFGVSKTKAALVLFILCSVFVWIWTIIGDRAFPLSEALENKNIARLLFIMALLGFMIVATAATLIFKKAFYLHIHKDGMTFHPLFTTYRWNWGDIDRLHLGGKADSDGGFTAVTSIASLLVHKFANPHSQLRFTDYAYNEKRTKRFYMKPESDGFVSLPLTMLEDKDAIFSLADRYHAEWYKKNQQIA